MFTKALLPDTFRAIKLVSKISTIAEAYLAGGTALSLHIGHRISVDLDFFTKGISGWWHGPCSSNRAQNFG